MNFTRNSIIAVFLAASLFLNAGLLLSGTVSTTSANTILKLKWQNGKLKGQNAKLTDEKRELTQQNGALIGQNGELIGQNGVLTQKNGALEQRNTKLIEAAAVAAAKITKQKADFKKLHKKVNGRLVRMTVSNVAALSGEIIPFFGSYVAPVATAYEVAESCYLAQDLAEMARELEVDTSSGVDKEICGIKIPFQEQGGKIAEEIRKKFEQFRGEGGTGFEIDWSEFLKKFEINWDEFRKIFGGEDKTSYLEKFGDGFTENWNEFWKSD